MKSKLFLLLLFVCVGLCKAQNPGSPEDYPRESQIIMSFLYDNVAEGVEFHIIELQGVTKFDFVTMKNKYITPEIFEDMLEENKAIFEQIKEASDVYNFYNYIPFIAGFRHKGSEEEWDPVWYFIFLDEDDNVQGLYGYYP